MNSVFLVIGAAGFAVACLVLVTAESCDGNPLLRFAVLGLLGCVATAFTQSFLLGAISVSVSLGSVAAWIRLTRPGGRLESGLFPGPKPLITLGLDKEDRGDGSRGRR